MSGFASVNFSESDQGLFSPAEIEHLMRVDYERAVRYRYPITLMLIEVDRLETVHDLYGHESKEEVLQAVISLLRSITRASDVLGCMRYERIMAVFPHTPKEAVSALAGRLLAGCRDLEFRSGSRSLRASLSIGVTAPRGQEPDFERFVRNAEEALAFAVRSGGDRFVENQAASDAIDALRQELETEERRLVEVHRELVQPAGGPTIEAPAAGGPSIEEPPQAALGERIRNLFRAMAEESPEMQRLEREVASAAERGVQQARDAAVSRSVSEHEEEIDVLERRLQRLKDLLDQAELELHRIAERKGVDAGIASIYRTVQGLTGEEFDYESRKEMLALMFEANVVLQRKMTRGS